MTPTTRSVKKHAKARQRRRGVELLPPLVVADSWFSDSKLMRHVAMMHQGTFLVEGKSTYVFALPDGRQIKGDVTLVIIDSVG